jgi:hypothetical protein
VGRNVRRALLAIFAAAAVAAGTLITATHSSGPAVLASSGPPIPTPADAGTVLTSNGPNASVSWQNPASGTIPWFGDSGAAQQGFVFSTDAGVANAVPCYTNQIGQFLTCQSGAPTFGGPHVTTFTASGTYTPTFTGTVEVQGCGGGGGGGGGGTSGGAGGGGGALWSSKFASVTAFSAITVTIGSAAAGGAAAASGTKGADATFGTLVSFAGASGGQLGTGSAAGSGGLATQVGGSNGFAATASTVLSFPCPACGGGGGLGPSTGASGGNNPTRASGSSAGTGGTTSTGGGGGGGGEGANGSGATGGNGSASTATGGSNASANTCGGGGGGGGASGTAGAGGNGGSGVILVFDFKIALEDLVAENDNAWRAGRAVGVR